MWGQPRDLAGFRALRSEGFIWTRTCTLRTGPELTPFPAVVGQERPWTCHSELVIWDASVQHSSRPEWNSATGVRKCDGRKLSAWIPEFPRLPIGPPLSLHYRSSQGSIVCCPNRIELIWAQPHSLLQPSQSPQLQLYQHSLKLSMEAETVFSWEYTTFSF